MFVFSYRVEQTLLCWLRTDWQLLLRQCQGILHLVNTCILLSYPVLSSEGSYPHWVNCMASLCLSVWKLLSDLSYWSFSRSASWLVRWWTRWSVTRTTNLKQFIPYLLESMGYTGTALRFLHNHCWGYSSLGELLETPIWLSGECSLDRGCPLWLLYLEQLLLAIWETGSMGNLVIVVTMHYHVVYPAVVPMGERRVIVIRPWVKQLWLIKIKRLVQITMLLFFTFARLGLGWG